jgi:hypothetical protein
MSHLTDKSNALQQAAALLHEKGLHPAAAHPAYYCCYQLMMHIWLHRMGKTAQELKRQRSSHEYLIWAVGEFIRKSKGVGSVHDFRVFKKIWDVKKLRTSADYHDAPFDGKESGKALRLSLQVIQILKKY